MSNVIPIITDHAREQWLRKYPAKFLACRMGHDFPKLIPGQRKFTRTWIEYDQDTGTRTIHQLCRNCSRERWRPLTGRNLLGGKSWKYKDPKGYAQPPGYGLTKGDFTDTYWPVIVGEYDDTEQNIKAAKEELANGH